MAAQEYSSFNFVTFLGVFMFLSLPTLLYWLGFWIWGDGYLFKLISWPFRKIFIREQDSKETTVGRKVLAGCLAVLVFILVGALINVVEEVPKYIFTSFSERALRNVEALAAILVLIIAVLAAGKTYRFVAGSKEKEAENQQEDSQIEISKKYKIVGHSITALGVVFALVMIFVSANEQQISAAYLFGEVIGASVLFGVFVILLIPKKWMKVYQTPILSVVFLASSIFIGYPQYKEARDARHAALSMAEAIEQEYIAAATAENIEDIKVSSIKVPASNEMAPFMNLISDSRERAAAIIIDYANSFPAGFEEILAPEMLSNITSIRTSKESVVRILKTIPSYKMRAKNHFNNMEAEIQSLDINQELKSGALEGFLKNKDSGIASFEEYFAIQEGMLQEFVSILELMEDAYGTYEFEEDGQVLFLHDRHIERYNDLMASITNYVLLEKEWGEKVQANELSAVKKMKEQYSE